MTKRNVRKKILKVATMAAVLVMLLAICGLDCGSRIPLAVAGACAGWLALIGYANNWFEGMA